MLTLSDVSIAMPYWVRQKELNRSLEAYRRLYGDQLEISICDDGSPVPVVAPGCKVTTLPRKRIGLNPCVPINVAVRETTRPIVVLTNPEIEHREDVLTGMLAMLEHEDDYVTVACRDVDGVWLAGPEVDYRIMGRMPVPQGAHYHFCAMFHRTLWDKCGGIHEGYRSGRSYEDVELVWSMDAVGARFKLAPGVVWHYKTIHPYGGTWQSNLEILHRRWPQART